MSNRYKEAGVDVEKGYEAVERMKKHINKTTRPEVLGGVGAFAGLFELTSLKFKEPVLVSGTDGVGTKLKLAFQLNKHNTIGIDLVAMCVNDIVAQGAQPLFFLDYIGCSENDPDVMEDIVTGISEGCVEAGAALIGGETAEMPGMYARDEYDLAGFSVGIAEKSELITGEAIEEGDVVIGLASSGVHSNGYSLVRQLVDDLDLTQKYGKMDDSLGEVLLTPTKIYAKSVAEVMTDYQIKGITHVTGGGFYENFPRTLPSGLGVELDQRQWRVPQIFSFLQEKGDISWEDMYGIFNMGIGMAVVVREEDAEQVVEIFNQQGEQASIIGEVTNREGVHFL